MAIIPFENQYLGTRLTRTGAVSEMAAIAGTIKSITVIALNVGSLGDFVFNVKKNGTALFAASPSDERIVINSANKIISKTGLNVATILGDKLTLELESVGAGGLLAPVYCLVFFDDGVSAGASLASDVSFNDTGLTYIDAANVQNALQDVDTELVGLNDDIADVDEKTLPSGGTTGQILAKQSGTDFDTEWIEAPSGGGASALDDLTDVVISSPTTGEVLKFNGTNWVNGTDATGGGGSSAETIISDDFSDGTISSTYYNPPATGFSESGGTLRMNDSASGSLRSQNLHNFNDKRISAKLIPYNSGSGSDNAIGLMVATDTSGSNQSAFDIYNSNLRMWNNGSLINSVSYNATDHAYLRMSFRYGGIAYQASADGTTWKTLYSVGGVATALSSAYFLFTTYNASGAPLLRQWDNFKLEDLVNV